METSSIDRNATFIPFSMERTVVAALQSHIVRATGLIVDGLLAAITRVPAGFRGLIPMMMIIIIVGGDVVRLSSGHISLEWTMSRGRRRLSLVRGKLEGMRGGFRGFLLYDLTLQAVIHLQMFCATLFHFWPRFIAV